MMLAWWNSSRCNTSGGGGEVPAIIWLKAKQNTRHRRTYVWINQIQYEIFTAFRHLSRLWIITAHFARMDEPVRVRVRAELGFSLYTHYTHVGSSGPVSCMSVCLCTEINFHLSSEKKQQHPQQIYGKNQTSRVFFLNFCHCCWCYTRKKFRFEEMREKIVKANSKQPAVHVDKCSTTELYIIHSVNILFGVCDG